MVLSIEDIFNMTEEELNSLIKVKYLYAEDYETLNEKRAASIILAFNNDDLIDSDIQYVKSKNFNKVFDKEPETAKKLKDLIKKKKKYTETYTLTFAESGENHKGMEILGQKLDTGFSLKVLQRAEKYFNKKDVETELIHLNSLLEGVNLDVEAEDAYLLIIRDGLSVICDADDFFMEQKALEKDRKAFMKGRVVNKHARANLCFYEYSQEPDYENKKGTIVKWEDVPLLNKVKDKLPSILGKDAQLKVCEGNYYEDLSKCYIGPHGDGERRRVVGIRVGAKMNLCYHWYYRTNPIGKKFETFLNHGDIYIMSEKAVGTDWMRKIIPTLRHAAGIEKYTSFEKKK